MIKVSAIHEAALLIAIHVGVVVSTVTLFGVQRPKNLEKNTF